MCRAPARATAAPGRRASRLARRPWLRRSPGLESARSPTPCAGSSSAPARTRRASPRFSARCRPRCSASRRTGSSSPAAHARSSPGCSPKPQDRCSSACRPSRLATSSPAGLVVNRLAAEHDFRLHFDVLDAAVRRHTPDTVVVIHPNDPDGGRAPYDRLVDFVVRTPKRVRRVIVDDSFAAFTSLERPRPLAPLVSELPNPRRQLARQEPRHRRAAAGYAVATPPRARRLRQASLSNLSAYAEWLCELLGEDDYRRAYEGARRRHVRDTRRLLSALAALPCVRNLPERGQLRAARARPPGERTLHTPPRPARRLRARLRGQARAPWRPVPASRGAHESGEPPHPGRARRRARRARSRRGDARWAPGRGLSCRPACGCLGWRRRRAPARTRTRASAAARRA